MTCQRRGPWSNAEDAYLMQLVQTHGPLNWVRIAQTLGSRTPKQCRERYHQNLKPTLNHDPITPEEGAQIERLVQELGKRWAEIARRLHGRSDNAVKNWWNGSQNRRKRLDRRRAVQSTSPYDSPIQQQRLGLPLPGAAIQHPCPPSPFERRPQGSWTEAPLPSPCASESPECESGPHYTTSPAQLTGLSAPTVELPPLRTWPIAGDRGSALPSLSTFASTPGTGMDLQQRMPPRQGQLPTAPNSPSHHEHARGSKERDSRMNLSALLG